MSWLIGILVTWVVTTISLLIISKLPIGVEIDTLRKAFISAAVFGVLNAILGPILNFLFLPFNAITLFLLSFIFATIVNAIIFALAAALVEGFRLRHKVVSPLIGAILLGIVNSLIFRFLPIG